MAAGGARISVARFVEAHRCGARTVSAIDMAFPRPRLPTVPAARSENVEARTGDEIARQQLLRHAVDHDFADEPGSPLDQAATPEPGRELNGTRGLQRRGAEGREERVGLGHDVVAGLVVNDVPRCARGPTAELVVPGPPNAFEVKIPQPPDAGRQPVRLLQGSGGGSDHLDPGRPRSLGRAAFAVTKQIPNRPFTAATPGQDS